MAASRQSLLLGALAVVAAGALAWTFAGGPAPGAAPGAAARPRAAAAAATEQGPAVDVRLGALDRDREPPLDQPRNPFRFGARTAAPPAAGAPDDAVEVPPPTFTPPSRPAGPPPAAPIGLKFFGLVERENGERVAALTDGRTVWYGREGDIIEGRYRILSIGAESIEVSYVDGRGRQTIRLSGQ